MTFWNIILSTSRSCSCSPGSGCSSRSWPTFSGTTSVRMGQGALGPVHHRRPVAGRAGDRRPRPVDERAGPCAGAARDQAVRQYVQDTAGDQPSAAEEIAKLAILRDQGAISEQEFCQGEAARYAGTWQRRCTAKPTSAGALSACPRARRRDLPTAAGRRIRRHRSRPDRARRPRRDTRTCRWRPGIEGRTGAGLLGRSAVGPAHLTSPVLDTDPLDQGLMLLKAGFPGCGPTEAAVRCGEVSPEDPIRRSDQPRNLVRDFPQASGSNRESVASAKTGAPTQREDRADFADGHPRAPPTAVVASSANPHLRRCDVDLAVEDRDQRRTTRHRRSRPRTPGAVASSHRHRDSGRFDPSARWTALGASGERAPGVDLRTVESASSPVRSARAERGPGGPMARGAGSIARAAIGLSPTSIRSPNGRVATTRRGAGRGRAPRPGGTPRSGARRPATGRRIFPATGMPGAHWSSSRWNTVMLGSVDDSHLGRRTP